jgi:uncharacterized protein (TIGR03085 family)
VSTITYVTDLARRERFALADLLQNLGPDQPTLCAGWTTRDLAAHVVVRDRRPDATIGMLVPPLREHGERVRRAQAAKPYEVTLAELRTPPRWSLVSNPLVEGLTNTGEFFIHHEDARRGQPDWAPRELDPGDAALLWRQARFSGRLMLGRLRLPVRVRAEGFGQFEIGTGALTTLTGPPGEVTLFLSGRQRAARVEVDGPDAERLRTAKLSL